MFNPLAEIYNTLIEKAQQDSETGALFHPQDLSKVIYLDGAPPVPFLQRLKTGKVNGDPHIWSQISLGSANGTSKYFYEGEAPPTEASVPTRVQNSLYQVGSCVEITDKQAQMYSAPGGFQLQEAERLRWFKEEMALQMNMRTREVLQEMDWILIQGDATVTIPASATRTDVQCDGALKWLTNNTVNASSNDIDEDYLVDLGQKIYEQYTGREPDVLYVTSAQKKIINTWTSFSYFNRNRNLEAGKDIGSFNTGYFVVPVVIEPYLPSGQCMMIDHSMFKKQDLLPLRAEPLARVKTSLKRMITYYGTLEVGNDRSSGKVYGLNQ